MPASVFHIELRQLPHTARRFNVSRAELHARFLTPWVHGQTVELDSQHFRPVKAKISIYAGRELETAELGMGRGWQNAARTGTDVTRRELEAARSAQSAPSSAQSIPAAAPSASSEGWVAAVAGQLVELCAISPVAVSQALALATAANRPGRLSARLAIAEEAVGGLLQDGRLQLVRPGESEPVAQDEWGPLLLAWSTWASSPPSVMLVAG